MGLCRWLATPVSKVICVGKNRFIAKKNVGFIVLVM